VLGRPVKEIHGTRTTCRTRSRTRQAVNPLTASGGGKGIPKLGATKQNLGVLALSGKLHLRGDVLGPEFLRRVKFVKYDEIHNALVRGAVRVTKQELEQHYGGKLPQGWEYVRTKPGQTDPGDDARRGDQHVPIDKLIPNAEDLHDSQLAKDGFSTTDPAARTPRAATTTSSRQRTGEGGDRRVHPVVDFTHTFVKAAVGVAVGGARPPRRVPHEQPRRQLASCTPSRPAAGRAPRPVHGDQGVARRRVAKKALDSAATPPESAVALPGVLPRADAGHVRPDAVAVGVGALGKAPGKAGAAWRARRPARSRSSRRRSRRPAFRQGADPPLHPPLARVQERLRSGAAEADPHVRDRRPQGPRRARRWRKRVPAADISKQVNQALGDYLNLSPVERNVLRNALPFYSWYKAIVTTTAHLAVDTPLRANILGQIGQIGKQWSTSSSATCPRSSKARSRSVRARRARSASSRRSR
jgi:hypothetical protein